MASSRFADSSLLTQDKPQPSTAHHAFTGSVPPIYDRHLGPVIFVPYADDLTARLRPRANARPRALE